MHYQYWPLQVTTPAGTPLTAPVTTPFPVVQGTLKRVEIDIPSGQSGALGLRLTWYGTVIYPWSLTGWLTPTHSGYAADWDDEIDGRGLAVQSYNTGRYPHTTWWRAEIWPTVCPPEATAAAGATGTAAQRVTFAQIAALRHPPTAPALGGAPPLEAA